jgi:cytochrome c553
LCSVKKVTNIDQYGNANVSGGRDFEYQEVPMNRILRPRKSVPLAIILVLMTGCSLGFGRSSGELPEMHKNLSRTVDLQTGVVQGDLGKAKEAASWLLSRRDAMSFPPSADEFQQRILELASNIAEARDMRTVAAQTGQLAAACGSCHQAFGSGPRFVVGTDAPGGDAQEALMIRHLWAADRMWEGLIGPSEEAWAAGAQAMAQTQPALARAIRTSSAIEVSEAFLGEVNLLANEALEAVGTDQRADAYGRILETCFRCHAPIGILVKK